MEIFIEDIRHRISLIFIGSLCCIFIVPIYLFEIGHSLGNGIQWTFYKYQITYLGSNLITLDGDIFYVVTKAIQGPSAISITLWAIGAGLQILTAIILVYQMMMETPRFVHITASLMFVNVLFYLASLINQYGLLFQGPAGMAIPIGIPLMIILAAWLWKEGSNLDRLQKEAIVI